jgi:CheY-like chemotaxis protein
MVGKAKQGLFLDIILTDCNMPVMDGYAATKEIKMMESKNRPFCTVPAVTANVDTADKEKMSREIDG